MIPNLTSQYISYSMAVFSANEIRTFLKRKFLIWFLAQLLHNVSVRLSICYHQNYLSWNLHMYILNFVVKRFWLKVQFLGGMKSFWNFIQFQDAFLYFILSIFFKVPLFPEHKSHQSIVKFFEQLIRGPAQVIIHEHGF